MHNIQSTWGAYFDTVLGTMPISIQNVSPGGVDVHPWAPPDEPTALNIERAGQELIDALSELGSYTYDFQLEMQNCLIGELFNNSSYHESLLIKDWSLSS
jgi:hypothetical protein